MTYDPFYITQHIQSTERQAADALKSTLFQAIAISIFALVYPVLCAGNHPLDVPEQEKAVPEQAEFQPEPEAGRAQTPVQTPVLPQSDEAVAVQLLDGEEVKQLSMYAYLSGVVAAEMPASFESEALKAQAVAARTYTLYCMQFCADKHSDADVCSDPNCCKAYADDSALRARWGADYDTYMSKIKNAVAETDGEYLVYEGEPILAVFHSSSNGCTEDSGNVWGSSLPYLQSVKSPETSQEVPGYITDVTVSPDDFSATILAEYPEAVLDGAPADWFGPLVKDASGRVETAVIGGVSIPGTALRSLFSLRSASIEITAGDDSIVLTTTGYGHGVGMSQYGANALAAQGKDYEEILQWYYTGAVLRSEA